MASSDDLLTALKNVVIALNNANQFYKQGYAQKSVLGASAPTLVMAGGGRVYTVSVTTAGTTVGGIYDSATIAGVSAANLIATIPITVGEFNINWPFTNGLVYVPGSGQVASISYT